MKYQYSLYANEAHSDINSLNTKIQLILNQIDDHYQDNANIDTGFLHEIQYCNNKLTDIIVDYFSHVKNYYYNNEIYQRFQISESLEDYLINHLDLINLPINELSENTGIIVKYINIKTIYDNIMADAYTLGMQTLTDQNYTNEQILILLDNIFTEFYECNDSLKSIYDNDNRVINMIRCYLFQLKNAAYIIEFFETIKQV